MSPTLEHAARLARLGFKAHWLAPPTPGKKASGKRPVDHAWQNQGYRSPEQIPAPGPGANLGIQTGHVSGAPVQVILVDLDSSAALEWARAHLPATPLRTVTGGGEHWYYRVPLDESVKVRNKCRLTTESGAKIELDIRGDGGNAVVAPSVHPSGHVYTEATPWDAVDFDAVPHFDPEWLDGHKHSAAMGRPRNTTNETRAREVEEIAFAALPTEPPTERSGLIPEHFQARLYNACARGAGGHDAIEALQRMAREEPYAPNGQRNATLFQAVRLLAEWFPEATDAQLEDFARASVVKTGDRGEAEELENFRDVLRRSREKFAQRDHLMQRLIAAGNAPTTAMIAATRSDSTDGAPLDLRGRLMVQSNRGDILLMAPDGSYGSDAWRTEALAAQIDKPGMLGWAEGAGLIQFEFENDKGKMVRIPMSTLLRLHSSPAREWVGTFNAAYSMLRGYTFVEAIAPKRSDLAPARDTTIAAWLRVLGGDAHELLLDWLAGFPDLERCAPALLLIGARKSGKNLLANGLAKLWKAGVPTPYETAQSEFNEVLRSSPLLFADERLPVDSRGRAQLDEQLRQLVTARTQVLNRKNMPLVTVHGCVRIIVATNHENFEFGGMTEEARAALAERILHIDVSADSRRFLERVGENEAGSWVHHDRLIKHVLYLADTRAPRTDSRLVVNGNGRALIDRASNQRGPNADLCEWLCAFLADPTVNIGNGREGIIFGNGELWVSTIAFAGGEDSWSRFVKHSRSELPSTTKLGLLLGELSGGVAERRAVPGEARKGKPGTSKYYRIDTAQLLAWADRNGADVEAIARTLGLVLAVATRPVEAGEVVTFSNRAEIDAALGKGAGAVFEALSPNTLFVRPMDEAKAREIVSGHTENTSTSDGAPRGENASYAHALSDGASGEGPIEVSHSGDSPKRVPGARHRKPCSAAHFKKSGLCICPAPVEAKSAKLRVREVEERGDAFYTPTECVWSEALLNDAPATELATTEWFAPHLKLAMIGAPQNYARTVNAFRAYKRALRTGSQTNVAWHAAMDAYFDRTDAPWIATSHVPNPNVPGFVPPHLRTESDK